MTCYIHADLDAFYASVEQLDCPEYRGKPVIVGGLPGDRRSVVSAASYEARKFGVHSAMPIAQAYRLCPHAVYLRGRMGRYHEKSETVMGIFRCFSPRVEQLSIDEAFIDIAGTEGLFGPPAETAKKLKARVKAETGLTVSVGLASNKYVAKIASGMSKPDGLSVIAPGEEETFMRSLPAAKIWGAGEKTQAILKKYGLAACEDIFRLSRGALASMFGNALGAFLYRAVRGEAAENFDREGGSHSISAERTFEYDLYDEFAIETALLSVCETLMWRLLSSGWRSATVALKIRYSDFSTEGIRETFRDPILTLNGFYGRARDLFRKKYRKGRGIRLIGAALMNLETSGRSGRQGDLFEDGNEKERRLEEFILSINAKHPNAPLRRSRSALASKNEAGARSPPRSPGPTV